MQRNRQLLVVNNVSNGEIFLKSVGFVPDTVFTDPDAWLITRNNTSQKLPACGTVSGLASSAVTATTATVSWSALSGAKNYDVDYKLASSGTWINAATATTSLSVNLGGLTAGSLYDWKVRANCTFEAGSYAQAQFTTSAISCGTVSGLTSSAVTSSTATVSWSAVSGANNYTVDYKLASSGTWINAAAATTSLSVNLNSLTASSLYDWRVRANCTGVSGAYAQAQFTTAASGACPGAYDISTNGTTGGAATIPLNTDIKGLVNPKGDNDHYKFTITTGGTITISLTTLAADYQLALLNSSGTVLQSSINNGTTGESINRDVAPGSYYARVYPKNNGQFNAATCYTLRVQTGTANFNGKFSVSPNPSTGIAKLAFNTETAGNATVLVINQTGSVVLRTTYTVTKGSNVRTLDVGKLQDGVYMIKIQTGSVVQVAKLVIKK
jgi:hypothetical protein